MMLRVIVLQVVALHLHGDTERSLQLLEQALVMAEPGGLVRIFVDEGKPMAHLLSIASAQGIMPEYVGKLQSAFMGEPALLKDALQRTNDQPLIEPLSPRELEILDLIAQGLTNREIGQRLFIALDTVKGHNRRIFSKLQVHRRTEAVARARELDLL